jgi:hypothetical protein
LEFWPVFLFSWFGPGGDIAATTQQAAMPDAADHFLSSAVRWFHRDSGRSQYVARLFWVQAAIPAA